MDHIREELDQLMGTDRNHPLHVRLQNRDHFDDPDVCKFNLIGFCPNDLFPNTRHDTGPCQQRHDDFLKSKFLNDPDRSEYQRRYEQDLIDHLSRKVSTVDNNIKKALIRAENPIQGNNRAEREQIEQAGILQSKLLENPAQASTSKKEINLQSKAPEMSQFQKEQLYARIDQLEQKIDFFITNAQKQGEEGNIEESEAIMIEVEKHRQQKKELEKVLEGGDQGKIMPEEKVDVEVVEPASNKPDRNMRVCEVCGALQSAADTDSRLTMHLEGKLHQGYQKIRDQLALLKNKRQEDRRRGLDKGGRTRGRSRSRSHERLRREAKEKLKDEAKLYFYYSSTRWGAGSNMPKFGSMYDQARIRLADLVVSCNNKNQDQLPNLGGIITLGKEWKYYRKDLEKAKRIKKKQDEKAAGSGGGREHPGGGGFNRDDRPRGGGARYGGLGKRDSHGARTGGNNRW